MEYNFFYTHLLLVPAITFACTVLLKGIFVKFKTGKVDLSRSLGSGGMPSVHSSVVVSLATAIAIKYGVNSDLFAMAMSFTVIIIYDAINVRFEAGQHAVAINASLGEKKFKESLGHLPSEAFAGSILGIISAVIIYYI
ncbi:MAG: divergent PAP2 family protein [Candidatus Gracilibacteria bacterium]|nr:divergent PAP2 family protein [Candidatus Gracilibacteria bacterium]